MRPGTRAAALITAITAAAALLGCGAPQPAAPLTKEQVAQAVNTVILNPAITCEELRIEFGITDLEPVDTPDQAGLAYEDHFILTADDQVLHLWRLPVEDPRGTIVLSMGAVGNMACYLYTAQLLHQLDYEVVMYEYRGFGGSLGTPSLESTLVDLNAAIDWTLTLPDVERVTLAGISLGSIPSIALAVVRPDVVNGVIVDSPVALGDQIRRLDLLIGPSIDEILALIDPRVVSEQYVTNMRCPLMIVMHDRDMLTPPSATQAIFDAAPGPKFLVRFPGAGHARAVFESTDEYVRQVDHFLGFLQTWDRVVEAAAR